MSIYLAGRKWLNEAALRLVGLCLLMVGWCSSIGQAEESATVAPDTQKMVIRVLDDVGNALSGANVHIALLDYHQRQIKEYVKPDVPTDIKGEVVIWYPHPVDIDKASLNDESWIDGSWISKLRISVSMSGYAPMQATFQMTKISADEKLTESYEFRLHKGYKLSGRIIDLKKYPVYHAKVQVDVDEDEEWALGPCLIYAPMAAASTPVFTDKDGYWEIDNAPGPQDHPGRFRLKINHPEYTGDTEWGGLQRTQRIKTEQLRDGTALIRMRKGPRLTGMVTDAQGNAITDGMVNWTKTPEDPASYVNVGLDQQGHFETGGLSPGSYLVMVTAPGHCPEQRRVEVLDEACNVDFCLQPGHVTKIRVVDHLGQAVQPVSVVARKWRGTFSLYEFNRDPKGVRKPRTGLATVIRPNKDNVCIWKSAPQDDVEYEVSSMDYYSRSVVLAASPNVHEIQLDKHSSFFGTVTDKVTGEPVRSFSVVMVKEDGEDTAISRSHLRDYINDANGKYELPIWRAVRKGEKYRVAIEADGYLTSLGTQTIGISNEHVQEDFSLVSGDRYTQPKSMRKLQ